MNIFLEKKQWNSKSQRVVRCINSSSYNTIIGTVRDQLYKLYLDQKISGQEESIDHLYGAYIGKTVKVTLLQAYDEWILKYNSLSSKDYSKSTVQKIINSKRDIERTIKDMGKNDLDFKNLRPDFIDKVYVLSRKNGYAISTINKRLKILKQVTKYAITQGYSDKDPIVQHKLKHEKTVIHYLTKNELDLLHNHSLLTESYSNIKDCFLFSCYTGLAYNEAKDLLFSKCYNDNNGQLWYKVQRKKTGKSYEIPLLPKAIEIIDKYKAQGLNKLPLISNQKFNDYIKEVCLSAGITKNVTHHMARKTFATTVLLGQGVSMEVVSKLLGHSSTAVTEASYADVSKGLIYDTLKNNNMLSK